MKKRFALFAALLMLLPTVLSGCVSADELAARRERTDEISKMAKEYMLEKYNRGFNVKKCEMAKGDEYEGDFFVTFNNDIHAFYKSDEEKFYDDRQTSVLNDDIYNDIWMPMVDSLNLTFDNIGSWSQDFNLVYQYNKGGEIFKYCMYHDYYYGDSKNFTQNHYVSVTSENLILVSDNPSYSIVSGKIRDVVDTYFHGKNDLSFYIVTTDYHSSANFDPAKVDETVDGCIVGLHFGETNGTTKHQFIPVNGTEGLYAMLCSDDAFVFEKGDITLEPVSNSDLTAKKIQDDMNNKELGIVDKYITKKRSIDFQELYTVKFSNRIINHSIKNYTLAFVMKDSDEDITEYADIKERERSFFAYTIGGDDFNATCLCSQNSRSTKFSYPADSETYFWFGTQF